MMEYNTQQTPMIISEYGRNIQKMVDYACTLKNKEERNKAANAIIVVMGALNPHLRDVTDFKHKLWDHIFIISKFKLDVESPYPKPKPESFQTKPKRVKYPSQDIKYKHYGKTVEDLIAKGIEMEEGDKKKYYVETLANLMKRSYLTWNRDSVNDEVIVQHLKELSKGKLNLSADFRFSDTRDILQRAGLNKNEQQKRHGKSGGGKQHGKKNYRNFKKRY